jgi:integrase/recombinase XerD
MAFSAKIKLAQRAKADKTRMVYLQFIIDRYRDQVPLGFYLSSEYFDVRRMVVKGSHANADSFNAEFYSALGKANDIASKFRLEGKTLTPEDFKSEFLNPSQVEDFIAFMKRELELKKFTIAIGTYRQHNTVVTKLGAFVKQEFPKWNGKIYFRDLTPELIQEFRNYLIRHDKVGGPTLNKVLKIVKQYTDDAERKGKRFKDPFELIKIKRYKSTRLALTQEEVDALEAYYDKPECPANHKKLLRYFLFSCYTGVRISDIKRITWNNVHGDLLVFQPLKTKAQNEDVTVPLTMHDKKFLPTEPQAKQNRIFDTFADPVTNRLLKKVVTHCKIKKKISYHSSRHTFGSLFAEGGNIIALQRMMGHEDMKTTMGYVHTNTKFLVDAKKERFGE